MNHSFGKRFLVGTLMLAVALVLAAGGNSVSQAAPPLPRAHAHNDYEHQRPLIEALDQGFCSVEADIYLVDGKLLVAHDLKDVKPERTLQKLYLEPLRERIQANGGHVYREMATNAALRQPLAASAPAVEFTLLIDLKRDGAATYRVLREVLAEYASVLTRFTPTSTVPGAVTVILSGDRPVEILATEAQRLCAVDGRLSDLTNNSSVHLIPWISESWKPTFLPFEAGHIVATDREKLRGFVTQAHAQGRRLRFWGVPNDLTVWREFYAEQVDLLNADNLPALAIFLQTPPKAAAQP